MTDADKALYIDVGNSALKYCLQDSVDRTRSLPHGGFDFSQILFGLMEQHSINQIYLASVYVPSFSIMIATEAAKYAIGFHEIKTTSKFSSLTNGYNQFDRLGVDRWLAMIAAHEKYPGECLIVSAGSAITCDLVDENGQHKGGVIMPGINMMQNSLLEHTAAVRFIENNAYQHDILQKDTAACVNAGTFNAAIGMIERIMNNYNLSAEQVVLTGGQAKLLASGLPAAMLEENLVLQGIACWHRHGELD